VVIGHTAQVTGGSTSEFQILGTVGADSGMIIGRWGANANPAKIEFIKSRNATIGSFALPNDNDQVGAINWLTDDGVDGYGDTIAQLFVEVDDATPANGATGGAMVIKTATVAGSNTEALRLDSSQDATFAGNVVLATGQGIDFSATSDGAGTTTSELLDDYEEGTFNSSVAPNGSGTITMSTSFDAGYYTKVGNVVNCWFHIRTTGVSSPVGSAVIAGMPFASYNQSQMRTAGSVINVSGLLVIQTVGGADDKSVNIKMGENTSEAVLIGDQSSAQAPGFSGDEELYCHISYMAA
jgi:hypothetical protein